MGLDEKGARTFLAQYQESKLPLVVHFNGEGATAVSIGITGHDGEFITGVGVARCNPIDHYNEQIGTNIATARALKNIVEQIENRWVQRARTKEEVISRRAAKKIKT